MVLNFMVKTFVLTSQNQNRRMDKIVDLTFVSNVNNRVTWLENAPIKIHTEMVEQVELKIMTIEDKKDMILL